MASAAFETQVPGKWVLTGEHSVLRGVDAVALPHPEFNLKLEFVPEPKVRGKSFTVESVNSGANGGCGLGVLLENWIDDIFVSQGKSPDDIPMGRLRIQSSIPLGGGVGSSAALCVALTRWLGPMFGVLENDYQAFATRLEDRFHVRSSGMDIAVCSLGRPIRYSRERGLTVLDISEMPRFTFHDTTQRSATRSAVERVKNLIEHDAAMGRAMDAQMAEASQIAAAALQKGDVLGVAQAMNLAQECFERWDIVPESATDIIQECKAKGALAAKLTGAGMGGFVVALWNQ